MMTDIKKGLLILVGSLLLTAGAADGKDESVPVLIYHEVLKRAHAPGETVISLGKFEEQMKYLKEHGYTTISVEELVGFMKGGSLPKKAVLLTLDDGWKSGVDAAAVLEKYRLKAAFFIFPGKGIGDPYMEWSDVLALAENPRFEICSHSMTHPWDRRSNLVTWIDGKTPGKDKRDAEDELKGSKKLLEKKLNKKVACFGWPVGWYNDALIDIAEAAGYTALFTAEEGANRAGGDLLRIKRIFIDGACDLAAFERMLQDHRYHVCQTQKPTTKGHSPYP